MKETKMNKRPETNIKGKLKLTKPTDEEIKTSKKKEMERIKQMEADRIQEQEFYEDLTFEEKVEYEYKNYLTRYNEAKDLMKENQVVFNIAVNGQIEHMLKFRKTSSKDGGRHMIKDVTIQLSRSDIHKVVERREQDAKIAKEATELKKKNDMKNVMKKPLPPDLKLHESGELNISENQKENSKLKEIPK